MRMIDDLVVKRIAILVHRRHEAVLCGFLSNRGVLDLSSLKVFHVHASECRQKSALSRPGCADDDENIFVLQLHAIDLVHEVLPRFVQALNGLRLGHFESAVVSLLHGMELLTEDRVLGGVYADIIAFEDEIV